MDVQAVFAENLKRFRLQRGLSQTALADAVGVSLQTVFSYEKAAKFPRPDVIAELASVLNVRPWQLIADAADGSTIPPELLEHLAAAARAAGLRVSLPK